MVHEQASVDQNAAPSPGSHGQDGRLAATIARARPASLPVVEVPRPVFRLDQPIVITIDGPAGTGKSSVAHRLAKKLGLDILDTGAMYRAAAAIALDQHIELDQHKRLIEIVRAADIEFDWKASPPDIRAFGKSFSRRIREPDVTGVVSQYAGVRELRELMVGMQRRIAHDHKRIVCEGRDQGSVVFPDAKVKFYLDASAQVRATRRADQLLREQSLTVSVDVLRAEIEARDTNDKSRPFGALVCPKDAIVVETSGLDLEQVVDALHDAVMRRSREFA
jgi:CMP/dCMP kinase